MEGNYRWHLHKCVLFIHSRSELYNKMTWHIHLHITHQQILLQYKDQAHLRYQMMDRQKHLLLSNQGRKKLEVKLLFLSYVTTKLSDSWISK